MEFLRRLFRLFQRSQRKQSGDPVSETSSGSPAPADEAATAPEKEDVRGLSDQELLTRLIFSKRHYFAKDRKPRPTAFDPFPHDELSTAHITGLDEAAIREIAQLSVRDTEGRRNCHGHSRLFVRVVTAHNLIAIRDDDPFDRHTVIKGWPQLSDDALRKKRYLEIGLNLSRAAEPVELFEPLVSFRPGDIHADSNQSKPK